MYTCCTLGEWCWGLGNGDPINWFTLPLSWDSSLLQLSISNRCQSDMMTDIVIIFLTSKYKLFCKHVGEHGLFLAVKMKLSSPLSLGLDTHILPIAKTPATLNVFSYSSFEFSCMETAKSWVRRNMGYEMALHNTRTVLANYSIGTVIELF